MVHSTRTPASSTTKTGLYDIAEIFLKVALNTHKNQIELKDCTDKYFQYASKMKNNKSALSDQLNNQISKSLKEGKSIPLTHKYMTSHFPSLVQALKKK